MVKHGPLNLVGYIVSDILLAYNWHQILMTAGTFQHFYSLIAGFFFYNIPFSESVSNAGSLDGYTPYTKGDWGFSTLDIYIDLNKISAKVTPHFPNTHTLTVTGQ